MLFKQQQKRQKAKKHDSSSSSAQQNMAQSTPQPLIKSSAHTRLQMDLTDLQLPAGCDVSFNNHSSSGSGGGGGGGGETDTTNDQLLNIMDFQINIAPSHVSSTRAHIPTIDMHFQGYYVNQIIKFNVHIPETYPYDPPKVKCITPIFHPNIDYEGAVCLSILREDWKPVLSLTSIIVGLLHLLIEPNESDALNKEAGELLKSNNARFQRMVALQYSRK